MELQCAISEIKIGLNALITDQVQQRISDSEDKNFDISYTKKKKKRKKKEKRKEFKTMKKFYMKSGMLLNKYSYYRYS